MIRNTQIKYTAEVIRKHLDGLMPIIEKVYELHRVSHGWTMKTAAREIQKQELVKLGILDGKLWP